MALSETDRALLERCLARKSRGWEDFVDRYMGLVVHVVNHSVSSRSMRIGIEDREDLVAHVFMTLVKDNMTILRAFRGDSSLATYLTVIARRVVVAELLKMTSPARLSHGAAGAHGAVENATAESDEVERLSDREEIERLLEELNGAEAQIVRMFHLEGKSYQEISQASGVPVNSVGPTLNRARRKMRRASETLHEER